MQSSDFKTNIQNFLADVKWESGAYDKKVSGSGPAESDIAAAFRKALEKKASFSVSGDPNEQTERGTQTTVTIPSCSLRRQSTRRKTAGTACMVQTHGHRSRPTRPWSTVWTRMQSGRLSAASGTCRGSVWYHLSDGKSAVYVCDPIRGQTAELAVADCAYGRVIAYHSSAFPLLRGAQLQD